MTLRFVWGRPLSLAKKIRVCTLCDMFGLQHINMALVKM